MSESIQILTLTDFLLARIAEEEAHAPLDSRALRMCEAKRRIVIDYMQCASAVVPEVEGATRGLHMALRHLTAVHADEPDYREESGARE